MPGRTANGTLRGWRNDAAGTEEQYFAAGDPGQARRAASGSGNGCVAAGEDFCRKERRGRKGEGRKVSRKVSRKVREVRKGRVVRFA